jgi:ferritin-like metal-binding protein YciE
VAQQMTTPQDLFVHELSDIMSGEQIIAQMLADGQKLVDNDEIKQGLQKHEAETKQQIDTLQAVFKELGQEPEQLECHAAKGLQAELQEIGEEGGSPEVLNAGVLGGAAKTEHYEIAAYTGLVKKAKAMGQTEVADLLEKNLRQERNMLRQIEKIEDKLNKQVAAQR